LQTDSASSSPAAATRILNIRKNSEGEEGVEFNIVLQKEFQPDDNVFKQLCGVYMMSDKSLMEFYRKGDLLILKSNGPMVNVNVNFYRQAYKKDVALQCVKTFKY
jgi:catechol 1,2-dioxygenase